MRPVVPLVAAKLLPPHPGPFHLPRPRLHARLAAGLGNKATVVLAGPGYGKTALVSRFLQEQEEDSVWYRVDPADRDPWLFFRYLIQGIQEHAAESEQRIAGLWRDLRSRSGEVERLADIFISNAEECLGGRLILVLDSVENFEPRGGCARALKRLLAYLPGALHPVLVGRALPDIGLRAMQAEGAVNLLQGDDLRFTVEETAKLLQETFTPPVPPETVEQVQARTRGWVTGLQLFRQTVRSGRDPREVPENVFARTEAEIFEYFSEEVFASESPATRDLLLGASPPAIIDPEICAEVLPEVPVRPVLSDLVRRNLFLSPLESRGEYYAFDPLFRDFLRRKLVGERGVEGRRELDLRYGRALARRGDFDQALTHLLAAEEIPGIVDLLRLHGKSLLNAGFLDRVREATQFVAGRGARPAVIEDLLGEACRQSGDHAAAIAHFERALASGAPEFPGTARASALQGMAYSLLKTGRMDEAERTARQALKLAGSEDPGLAARIRNTLSIIRYREHRLHAAMEGWQEALRLARRSGDEHLILMIAHNLGLPHAVMGDFRRASECFRILTGPDNPRLGPEEGAAYLNLARIETLAGNYDLAASLLGDAREIARKWDLQALAADVLEAEGTLLRETGDLDGAGDRYARARARFTGLGQTELLDGLEEEEAILAARKGDAREAERIASQLLERRRTSGNAEGLASTLLALGEVRVRSGDGRRALPLLAEAAKLFPSLEHGFQAFLADLWLARAAHAAGRVREAKASATRALRAAAEYNYQAALLRVAASDPAFHRFLASLPEAPGFLKEAREPVAAGLAPPPPAVPGVDLAVQLLGPIQVFRDAGRPIPARAWKVRRALQLFCYLASSRDHRATKDRIVEALWGDARISAIERNFHPTISFLRNALNFGHQVPKNFILYEQGAYRLNPEYRYFIDTHAFEAKMREARARIARGDRETALADFEAALALYRGPLLEDLYDAWIEPQRAHYAGLYLSALEEAGRLHLQQGDRDRGVALLQKLVEHDPLDEKASVLVMEAFGATRNRGSVEKEFRRLTRALRDELATPPLPETRRAYERALQGEDSGPEGARTAGANPPPRLRRPIPGGTRPR